MNPSEKEILQMDEGQHWERIYGTKAPDQVSWYRPHLETWLALIERAQRTGRQPLSMGWGPSTLVDDPGIRQCQGAPEPYQCDVRESQIQPIAQEGVTYPTNHRVDASNGSTGDKPLSISPDRAPVDLIRTQGVGRTMTR